MPQRPPTRVYAYTSVYGGVFDAVTKAPSAAFFEQVRSGRIVLLTSRLVQDELQAAPAEVKELYGRALEVAEVVEITGEVVHLAEAYMQAEVISSNYTADAIHVALASVYNSMIVSWNFRHIVNFRRIPLYNAVNTLRGYSAVAIYSPFEVIEDG